MPELSLTIQTCVDISIFIIKQPKGSTEYKTVIHGDDIQKNLDEVFKIIMGKNVQNQIKALKYHPHNI